MRTRNREGLPPNVWGQCAWTFIHHVALGYPTHPTERDIHDYSAFFESLSNVLPCKMCRTNLRAHLAQVPPEEALRTGKRALFEWTVSLHNAVNASKLKPIRDPVYMYPRYHKRIYAVHARNLFALYSVIVLLLFAVALAWTWQVTTGFGVS